MSTDMRRLSKEIAGTAGKFVSLSKIINHPKPYPRGEGGPAKPVGEVFRGSS